jgi:hypothetical protein
MRAAAGGGQQAIALERVFERDRIDWLPSVRHCYQRTEDDTVTWPVEVVGGDDLARFGDQGGRLDQRSEQGFLGVKVRRLFCAHHEMVLPR